MIDDGPRDDMQGGRGTLRGLRFGLKHAPEVTKVAIGAFALFFVATIVLQNRAPISATIFVATIVLILGAVALLTSRAVLQRGRRSALLGHVVAWAIVLNFIAVTGLTLSSTFFGVPVQGAIFVARLLSAPEIIRPDQSTLVDKAVSTDQFMDNLDATLFAEETSADPISRVANMTKKPSLSIRNARLSMRGNEEKRVLSVSRLEISDGAIITNGGSLKIQALEIVSNNGTLRAHELADRAGSNHDGKSGGQVTLVVFRDIAGILTVNLDGQAGAAGDDGVPGGPGTAGAEGDHSASGAFDCSRGPGRGANGGPGQPGRPGEAGGNGGDGGRLYLVGNPTLARDHVAFSAKGGAPGRGGRGGPGGPGGPGGSGGASGGWCSGRGPNGEQGPPGADGPPGQLGRRGTEGRLILEN